MLCFRRHATADSLTMTKANDDERVDDEAAVFLNTRRVPSRFDIANRSAACREFCPASTTQDVRVAASITLSCGISFAPRTRGLASSGIRMRDQMQWDDASSTVGLEHPLFGQFARQLFKIRSQDLEDCLRDQERSGGRSGELLQRRHLLTRDQVRRILRTQARWVAAARSADVEPLRFPLPVFVSICLPAYNEELNIEETLDAACAILPEFIGRFEVVVVDDGSQDATAQIVERYAEDAPEVRLVRHATNLGYGAAVTTGLKAALGDLIAFTDCDGQFSFLDLPQMLVHMDGHDAVVGYRYHRADNIVRRLNAWAWNRLIRFVLRVRVRDVDCAFKLFRREVIERLELTSTGAAINAEIMTQCAQAHFHLCQLPVTHYRRYHGAPTGAALRVIARAFRELSRLLRTRAPAGVAQEPARRLPS